MNFPVYTSQVGLPVQRHVPQPSPLAFGGSGHALVQLGQTLEQAGDEYSKAENKRVLAESHAEAANLQAQFELTAAQYDAQLKRTEIDPDAYWTKRTEYLDGLQTSVASLGKKKYTGQILDTKLPGLVTNLKEKAIGHVDALRVSGAEATRDQTAVNAKSLSALTPYDDNENQGRVWALIVGAAKDAEPYLGKAATEKWLEQQQHSYVKGIAESHLEDKPLDFVKNSDRYAYLGATELVALRDKAEGRINSALERQRAADARRDTALKALLKADTDAMVNDFDKRANEAKTEPERQAVLKDLDYRVEMRMMPDADARRLREHLTNPKAAPSDATTLSRVGLDSESTYPKTTEAEIDRLHERFNNGQPGLNYPDSVRIKQQLRTTRHTITNEAKADKVKEHNQAEQELRAWLGIKPGLIERMTENINTNDPITRLYAQGLSQLRARSNAFDGSEAPLKVVDELGPRLQRTAGVTKEMQAETIRAIVSHPTRQALEAAYQAGTISKGQYLYDLRLFDQLDKVLPQAPSQATPRAGQVRPRL